MKNEELYDVYDCLEFGSSLDGSTARGCKESIVKLERRIKMFKNKEV